MMILAENGTSTIAQGLAERIASTQYEALPDDALHWARVSILDTLGVALAGAIEEGVGIADRMLAEQGAGPSLVFRSGRRIAPPDAAFINGIAAHSLDFDASSAVLVGHPSVHLLPALLALAEARQASGAAFTAAYIAGFEVQSRIARAIQPHHAEKGWFPGGTIGVFGTAAGCAHLLGLDREQTTNCLGIAANLASGLMVNAGTMSKPLAAGQTARNGLLAALFASGGFTASANALEDRRGFLTVYNGADHLDMPAILADWGAPYDIVETAYGLKRHPCCGVLQSSIDVMADLVAEHDLSPANVARIDAELITTRFGHVDRPQPRSNIDAKFSLQYCLARTLLQGRLRSEDFEGDAYRDAAVAPLMRLVHGGTHPETDPDGSRKDHGGVEIRVTLQDGSQVGARVAQPFGRVPGAPLPQEMLEAKFIDCATRLLSAEAAHRLLELVRRVDRLDRVNELTAAITPRAV
jgi:2-methylcitrate dehydratase PrpD